MPVSWSVYLLVSGNRTYVGSTTDPHRRLRQHNGEIVGGARATRGKKWELYVWVSGFENRSSACRWEKLVKMRARGKIPRCIALEELVFLNKCPAGRRDYLVPAGLNFHNLKGFPYGTR